MQIIPLSEGAFTIDRTKRFVPFDTGKDDLQQRPVGSLLVEIQPFAIITSEDILVIDTGLGFRVNGELQLYNNLRKAGIGPEKVTKVLMSHLHKDHAGGITKRSEVLGDCTSGPVHTPGSPLPNSPSTAPRAGELSFPNAQYYVQRNELEYAFEKGPTSYIPDELLCLKDSPRVTLLDGDGVIDGYIRYVVTGAHCPYHQVFWIVDGGETAFFGGDVAPQLQQMKSRFVAKYDYDGKKAMELRQEWWERGGKEGWTFLFYHDVNTPTLKRD